MKIFCCSTAQVRIYIYTRRRNGALCATRRRSLFLHLSETWRAPFGAKDKRARLPSRCGGGGPRAQRDERRRRATAAVQRNGGHEWRYKKKVIKRWKGGGGELKAKARAVLEIYVYNWIIRKVVEKYYIIHAQGWVARRSGHIAASRY